MLNFFTKVVALAVVSGSCSSLASIQNEIPNSEDKDQRPKYYNETVSKNSTLGLFIDWCDSGLKCEEGLVENSMCIMKKSENKDQCYFMEDAMHDENRRVLLAYHNSFRDQLASGGIPGWPPAGNMRQLRWDDILEEQATLWALQCKHGLDPCPVNPMTRFVGQAMMNLTNTKGRFHEADPIFSAMINHSDPKVYNRGTDGIGSFISPPNAYTNFVQVSFARQTRVGCSLIHFLQHSNVKLAVYATKLTCFYAQEIDKSDANAIGYMEGQPCSYCPNGTRCNPTSMYKHLCSTPQDPLYDSYTIVLSLPSWQMSNGYRNIPPAILIYSHLLLYVGRYHHVLE